MKRYRRQISLNGTWKFRTDPDGMGDVSPDVVRNTVGATAQECKFFDPEFDDRHWGEIAVPACWQAEGHLYNGVAWYRTRFEYQPGDDAVVRLAFQGVDYFADAWINGYYLGSHEGFFAHFAFDVSRWIRAGENLLVVRVESPKDTNVKVGPNDKTLVKGALPDWDCNNLDINPGGIFADVRLIESRQIAVQRVKATPYVDAEGGQARVHFRVTLVNPDRELKQVALAARVAPDNFAGPESAGETEFLALVPGASEHELWVEVAEPRLWWPWDMGEQNLYRFMVSATDAGGAVLDEVSDRIGLRHLRQVPGTWECYVNGKRIFCRGPNYLSEQLQSNMTRAKYEADVRLMREANMNMVRVYCVVEKEEFYDVCDELGMLVLQDFPAQGALSDSSDLVRRAVPQGRDMVNQLYHHPSIIIWALGEQPSIENFEKLCHALVTAAGEEDPTRFLQQGACVWEWQIAREKYDWPIDYHLLCGWFPPDMNYLFKPFRTLPDSEGPAGNSVADLAHKKRELLEFVGEFGPPESLPNLESLCRFLPENERWPLDWKALERRCVHGAIMLRWIPEPQSLQQLIDDSQDYQAFLYKYHVEFYRRHKFDPCNGCLFFHFKDCWPAITASVVDYYGEKKKAYHTLKRAFSPLHVMMEWPDLEGEPAGATVRKAVHVVNDYHRPYDVLTVQWQVIDDAGAVMAADSIACGVAENGIAAVGEVAWEIPPDATEPYTVRLRLDSADQHVSGNEYLVKVRPG
jgi:beta-mannosidase